MKKLFILAVLFPVFAFGQSTDQNYIKTKTYREASGSSPKYNITYFDGLGRPIEQIAHKQSGTAEDVVTAITYDALGRQNREYLPVVSGSTLNYHGVTPGDVATYYGTAQFPTMATTAYPYTEKLFEASPLNRILEQAAPGESWRLGSGHEVHFDYQTNDGGGAGAVKLFTASATWEPTNEKFDTTLNDLGLYDPNVLYKTITKSENWQSGDGVHNTTEEFKDKEGKVVLKRTYGVSLVGGSPVDESHDTYYVYDDYGNLTFVIPPVVDVSSSITTTILEDLCYQYKYDSRNRLVEKKLPGKDWEFIVYNNQDKPVATGPMLEPWGDGSLGWMITKYDAFGRVVYTGWYDGITPDEAGRKSFQDNMGISWAEKFDASAPQIDGVTVQYTNDVLPIDFKLLTVNYYDKYTNPFAGTPPSTIEGVSVTHNVKSLPMTTWTRVLTAHSETYAEVVNTIYDSNGRVLSTRKTNHLGGSTIIDNKLDFMGRTVYTIGKHKYDSSPTTVTVKDMFEYNDQDRLLLHKQKINALDEQLIVKNDYDELGQLLSKQVGGEDVSTYAGLQKVDYKYNIRGWLTNINKLEDLNESSNPEDLFAFKINYDISDDYVVPELYNGNIAETFWVSNSDNVVRKYSYQYDGLNRLKNAMYQKPNSIGITNMYDEQMDYDKNGNIQHLNRNGDYDADSSSLVFPIDELEYKYDTAKANQLLRVQDFTGSSLGFKDDDNTSGAPDDYTYDAFGNMVSDTNKSIESISYNHLNLPVEINFVSGDKIKYLYNATGQKVRKTVTMSSSDTVTDYQDGFQYTNAMLSFFPHAEGYVNVIHCSECEVKKRFNYVFNYLDHLGNIRMSYAVDPEQVDLTLKILEENHYYPFGLKHTNYNAGSKGFKKKEEFPELTKIEEATDYGDILYKYKYNGKEYQDELGLNMYDYGARNYDPALGRWMNIDPLAEQYRKWSPYNYCVNNPMRFTDPDGMGVDDVILGGAEKQAAFTELQKSVQGQLNLTMDSGGKVEYTPVQGATVSADAQQLTTAIDDHSVTVNVTAENTKYSAAGSFYIGGTFSGNTVTTSPTGNTVSTSQEINPSVLSAADNYYGTSGSLTLHEVTESYQGGLAAKQSGISVGPATQADVANPTSAYSLAHKAATPQNMTVTQQVYDSTGNEVFPPYPASSVRATFSVQQGTRLPLIIMTLP